MSAAELVHHYCSELVGWMELRVSEVGVRAISYIEQPTSPASALGDRLVKALVDQLDRYFAGTLTDFTIPLDLDFGTPFEHHVWEELARIPYGETRSYGEIAARIGNPKAARAVGQANNKNRIPILIPCHRVVQSGGKLGGYASGMEIKKRLLELENAHAT